MEEKKKTETSEIKEIVLQIGRKEIRLTPDECKKLKETLSELFGKEVIREVHETHHYHNNIHDRWYYYPAPAVVWPTVYCTSAGDNISYSGGTMSINCNPTTT